MSEKKRILEITHLVKSFGNHEVLKDIHFSVDKGDVISIIGASGSGKSTLLRCVNLLETPTSGSILYHGEDITDAKMNIYSYREKVGMVFQSFNLFQNMTVLENCMVGPIKVKGTKKGESQRAGHDISHQGRHGSVHQCQAPAAFRRPAAEGGHRQSPGHGT